MPDELTTIYLPFAGKGDASTRMVEGHISGNGNLDLDQQIVDPAWLKSELPTWFAAYGNVREMHGPRAVGKAKSIDLTHPTGPYMSAKIIDADAWEKVQEGVYNGFSVGIKGPKYVFDGTAKNGRIVGGTLVEVSIVDRPANDAAKFVLVKRAGANEWKLGDAGPVVEDLAKAATPGGSYIVGEGPGPETFTAKAAQDALVCQPCGCGPDGAVDGCTCDCVICTAAKATGKAAAADLGKRDFDTAARNRLADSGAAMPDGGYPIANVADLHNAIQAFGRAKDKAATKAHIIARAKVLGATDQLPADWPGSTQDKEQKMTDQQTEPVAADVTADADTAEKAAASHVEHRHPFKGTHNHAHAANSYGGAATHTHAHLHNDDDMHDHPHLNGTDARLLSPEDRESAMNVQRASGGAYMAADADTSAATADATKSAADFQAAAPAGVNRPAKIGSVEAILKDAAERIAALSRQMDDGDGDIDTPANEEPNGPGTPGKPAADFVAAQGGSDLISPLPLSLTFATEADLTKFIDARVSARLAEQPDFITKAAIADTQMAVPEIAKLASGIAKGLEALADRTKATTEQLEITKAALASTQADLEAVKLLAQPVKGAVFAIEKGIGLDSDRIYRDGVIPEGVTKAAEAARLIATLSDQERRDVSTAVLTDMYKARQQA